MAPPTLTGINNMTERTTPEAVGLSGDRLQRITPWMADYVASGKLPGCLTAVMRRGKLAYLAHTGMADPDIDRPVGQVDGDTQFHGRVPYGSSDQWPSRWPSNRSTVVKSSTGRLDSFVS